MPGSLKKKLQNAPFVIAAREEASNRAMIKRYVALAIKLDSVSEKEVKIVTKRSSAPSAHANQANREK